MVKDTETIISESNSGADPGLGSNSVFERADWAIFN
jgi:hypothetical protein